VPEATCEFTNHESANLPGIQLIAETVERLRGERGELEEFLETMFAALEDVGTRLTQRQGRLSAQEAQLQEREEILAQRQRENENLQALLQAQASQLETMAEELQSVRTELAEQRAAAPAEGGAGQLQGVVEKLEEQRDDLKQRLDVCREELARRNDATEQLAKTQSQLASAREEILSLRDKIEETREAGPADPDAERERFALETELEMVRRRAAELSETLAEQKDQMAQQQAMWSAELNQLRHLMDAHNGAWISQTATQEASASATVPNEPRPQTNSTQENPVVDSIMQQFAKLQQDVAQRRKRSKQ